MMSFSQHRTSNLASRPLCALALVAGVSAFSAVTPHTIGTAHAAAPRLLAGRHLCVHPRVAQAEYRTTHLPRDPFDVPDNAETHGDASESATPSADRM